MIKLVENLMGVFENNGNHKYSFVKIEVPKEITEKVISFGLSIPDDQIFEDINDPSFGRELEVHITVKYGLETKDYKEIDFHNLADNFPKEIEVKLKETFVFNSENYDVLNVGVESQELEELHNILNKLPNKDEHPKYIPHMCIAYLKKGYAKYYEGKDDFINLRFKVDEVVFKNPEGDSRKIKLNSSDNLKEAKTKITKIIITSMDGSQPDGITAVDFTVYEENKIYKYRSEASPYIHSKFKQFVDKKFYGKAMNVIKPHTKMVG